MKFIISTKITIDVAMGTMLIAELYLNEKEKYSTNDELTPQLHIQLIKSYTNYIDKIFIPIIFIDLFYLDYNKLPRSFSDNTNFIKLYKEGESLLNRITNFTKKCNSIISSITNENEKISIIMGCKIKILEDGNIEILNDHGTLFEQFNQILLTLTITNDTPDLLRQLINKNSTSRQIFKNQLSQPIEFINENLQSILLLQKKFNEEIILEKFSHLIRPQIVEVKYNYIKNRYIYNFHFKRLSSIPKEKRDSDQQLEYFAYNLMNQYYQFRGNNEELENFYQTLNKLEEQNNECTYKYIILSVKLSVLIKLKQCNQSILEENKINIIYKKYENELNFVDSILSTFAFNSYNVKFKYFKLAAQKNFISALLSTIANHLNFENLKDVEAINFLPNLLYVTGQMCCKFEYYDLAAEYFTAALTILPQFALYLKIEKFINLNNFAEKIDIDNLVNLANTNNSSKNDSIELVLPTKGMKENLKDIFKSIEEDNNTLKVSSANNDNLEVKPIFEINNISQNVLPDLETIKVNYHNTVIKDEKVYQTQNFISKLHQQNQVIIPINKAEKIYTITHRFNNKIQFKAKISKKLNFTNVDLENKFIKELDKGTFCSRKHYQNGIQFFEIKINSEERVLGYLKENTIIFNNICLSKNQFDTFFKNYQKQTLEKVNENAQNKLQNTIKKSSQINKKSK